MKTILSSFNHYRGLPKEIYILTIQRFINSVGGFVHPLLVMFLTKRIGLDTEVAGFFMLIATFASLPGSIISGFLVDRYSRKRILLSSRAISATIFMICGFLGNSIWVAYLIILSNFFWSFSKPATSAMTADLTTPQNRKQSYSLLYLGMNLGLAFGFMLAGYLFENYTRWLFWGDGITSYLSLLLVIFFIKDTKPSQDDIQEINASYRQSEKEEKGNSFRALCNRPYVVAFIIINAMIWFVYQQHSFIMPLHLEELSPEKGSLLFGHIMTINTIIVLIFTPILLQLTSRNKPIVNIGISVIAYIIGFGMLAFSSTLWPFFISVIIWTSGEIIGMVNTGVYVSNHTPVNHRGRFIAFKDVLQSGGRSLGPWIMGSYLTGRHYSQGWALTALVGLVILGLVIILFKSEETEMQKSLKIR
ncbi:MDR family MFS transporter [Vallitalea okinawensis]|uniref:MDR family MFS transporter n=1 Tax=Vallitalea okinawensis TaxID=2078660 RepID=UPI00147913D6|nr:MFS transporter [Vallitalea okinawensis]